MHLWPLLERLFGCLDVHQFCNLLPDTKQVVKNRFVVVFVAEFSCCLLGGGAMGSQYVINIC